MEPLRTAIIGCGGIANAHAQRLAGLADVHLVGLCDRVTERADVFNQRYAEGKALVYEGYQLARAAGSQAARRVRCLDRDLTILSRSDIIWL